MLANFIKIINLNDEYNLNIIILEDILVNIIIKNVSLDINIIFEDILENMNVSIDIIISEDANQISLDLVHSDITQSNKSGFAQFRK
jgi:hypothetical protein